MEDPAGKGKWSYLTVVAAVLLSSCSFVPTYKTPSVPLASHWQGSQEPGKQIDIGGQWWTAFNSAELNDLIARGLANNNNLQAALSRIDEAEASAQVAGGPNYPSVSLGGLNERENNYSTTQKRSLYLEATYEFDFWGKARATAHSSQALALASRFDAQTMHMTLSATIADTYFQVLSLDERLRLARTIADDAGQVLTLVTVQASQGAVSNLEVAQQKNAQQTFQAAIPILRQQRDLALYQLTTLVGVPPEGFTLTANNFNGIAIPRPALGVAASLLFQRPDVAAAEARLRSANFDIGVARAALLPNLSIDLIGGIDTLGGNTVWSSIGTLTQPIFMGGALHGQVRLDRAHAAELAATYRETLIEALQDVETQLSAARNLDKAYDMDEAAVVSAREADRLSQVRYRLGATDFQTLLIVERTLYQAEDTLLQVRLQHLQAAVGLFRALGGDFRTSPITQMARSNVPPSPISTQATQP
ncbi:MAG: efflux transporter outer membrane subunit [Janthinobacterium lividum]